MFSLSYFKEKDMAVVKQFMRDNLFAFLMGVDAAHQPVATQVPLLMEERAEKIFLLGHVQRKTDHQMAFEQNPHVLAVFAGPSAYVSASWYKDQHSPSTINYISVHAKGLLRFLDQEALLNILSRTTARFENNPASPSLVEDMPQADIQKMMQAIIAFEIEITHLDNVFKLSQNREIANYTSIIDHLNPQGGAASVIAAEMQQRRSQIFNAENKAE